MAEHKHAEVIHAYADGKEIQVLKNGEWIDLKDSVRFFQQLEYRIKPVKPERLEYCNWPTAEMYRMFMDLEGESPNALKEVVEEAIKRSLDAGQVVTREEFDRALGDRKERDTKIAKAISHEVMTALSSAVGLPVTIEEFKKIIENVK